MKRVLFFAFGLMALAMTAQDIDMSFVFVDADGQVLENGATVVRNTVETLDETSQVIYSGISVKNASAASGDYIKMHYTIEQIDNGSYQICFPTTCNYKDQVGTYETTPGQLMGDVQGLQSEWLTSGEGSCIVTLSIELMAKVGFGFPPTYVHKANGPTLTIKFVNGDVPGPEPLKGDVNGDSEVNIADVNTLINMILAQNGSASADVNGDGEINLADVNTLIDMILNN